MTDSTLKALLARIAREAPDLEVWVLGGKLWVRSRPQSEWKLMSNELALSRYLTARALARLEDKVGIPNDVTIERLTNRVAQLEEAISNGWRQVTSNNADCCGFCDATISARQQDRADGAGWDLIKHIPDCIVLTLPTEALAR